ncbi:DPH5 [Lepeophtheirus salmonis]|uniref:diphthine methyl ester synthase n=1 Tax=Lepeophtheirus salmonis TaxID=72036 RepID=A0A7R8CSC1_LEPSM|nr:DPH5 [Lepeophtheirus salmonis]CAF2875988.1 DPH5 [Lepeophtheirus salmonis]
MTSYKYYFAGYPGIVNYILSSGNNFYFTCVDITVKGLEIVKKCDLIFLESYTSILGGCSHQELESFYGKEIIVSDRECVESGAERIIESAGEKNVAFLVVGDPFGATTHQDLFMRAMEKSVKVEVIHNTSIINAIASCGLWLYRFGEIISIPFWDGEWRPTSFFDRIVDNFERGLHTLCLLDIKPPRFMSVNVAAQQLLDIVQSRDSKDITSQTQCIAAVRVGTPSQRFLTCTLEQMKEVDMGGPLHSLVVIGKMNAVEEESLKCFCETS